MVPIIVRLALATLSAILGGLVAIGLGRDASRRMLQLVFIALGTLLAVTLFDVLPDAKQSLNWPVFLAAAASGYLVFWLISRYLYSICPACAAPGMMDDAAVLSDAEAPVAVASGKRGTAVPPPSVPDHTHEPNVLTDAFTRLQSSVWLLTAALAIHCTVDGLAIVVGDDIAHGMDLPVLLAVMIHKLPEGMALALFLLSAGRRPSTALIWTTLVEMSTLVGGLFGARLLTHQSEFWLALVFAHVGGGFIYLVATTLGGFMHSRSRSYGPIAIGGGVAFIVTAALLLSLHDHVQ